MKNITITIDGVGGAGKGTTAKGVAKKLNYTHIDSGAIYRAVTFFLHKKNVNYNASQEVIDEALKNLNIDFNNQGMVLMNNKNIENKIRTDEIDDLVFEYAKRGVIRNFVKKEQHKLLKNGGVVIDGRDTGSVVFPKAELKIFITCDIKERARRRAIQYGVINDPKKVIEIENDFKNRDYQDEHRKHSPLIIPKNAVIIDTTNLTIDEQIEKVYKLALQKIKEKND